PPNASSATVELRPLLRRLRTLLEQDDTYAIELVDELDALPGLEAHAGIMRRLRKATGDYAFDQALRALQDLEVAWLGGVPEAEVARDRPTAAPSEKSADGGRA